MRLVMSPIVTPSTKNERNVLYMDMCSGELPTTEITAQRY